jgi:hypothetical protein
MKGGDTKGQEGGCAHTKDIGKRHQKKTTSTTQKKGPNECNPHDALILDFKPPEL